MSLGIARSRDRRIADEAGGDRELMCSAQGCPNRWSVDQEGRHRLCSAHAWADAHDWPRITGEQQHAETQRAWERQNRPKDVVAPRLTLAQKVEILSVVRQLVANMARSPRAWALSLQRREQDGEWLSVVQKQAWRTALRFVGDDDEVTQ